MESVVIDGAKTVINFICSRIKTLSKYEENVNELHEEIANLTYKKMAIEEDVTLAKMEGKTPHPKVMEWLMKVSQVEDDVRPLLELVHGRGSKMMQCWTVAKRLDLVRALNSTHYKESSPIISVVEMAVPPLVGLGPASDMKQVLELLNKDDIRRIAIWGKGGIGKTVLVKNLSNELYFSSQNSFDTVIWVQVSGSMDLSSIQSQIAKRLQLKVEAGDTVHVIASGILQRLKQRRKALLILDDVWERIDLDAVGVPSRDPCCKILLTTRSRDVCRHMAVDVSFQLNLLSEEDAWNLFVHSAGSVLDINGIASTARTILAGFNGLPLAIKSLGNSMRDRPQIELWRNAHLMWRCSSSLFNNIEREIFGPLATSYHSLPSKTLKQCFLFCSLYPASFSIDVAELIKCWVSDGLIIENKSVEETYNYGLALIERLKDLCLLEQDSDGTVKMHDIFRDLAILLSQSQELSYGFHTQSGLPFYQMPNESARRVSFMRCRIQKLPVIPVSSQLTVLFLQDNPIQRIPKEFFYNLKSLRVLNLSETRITSLPQSFHCLSELRSLFLRNSSIKTLPSVKFLVKLSVLDLSGTGIKALPNGIGSLQSLRELNLSCTPCLNKIVAGSIEGLSSLETLNMSFSSYSWNPKTGADQQNATFNELLSTKKLSVLQIRLDSVKCLESASFWLKKLTRFDIQISPWTPDSNHHVAKHNEKRLVLRGVDLLQNDLQDLLHYTTSLDMITCVGMTQRHWLSLSSLTSLTISNCNDITRLISKERSSKDMFPNLRHLILDHLKNLETIVEGIIPRGNCLRNLTTLQVLDCPVLKGAVSYAMLHHVKKLEEIKVSGCENMSFIIESAEHDETLTNLRVIDISNMVNLRSICDGTLVCPVLQKIKVFGCSRLINLPRSISNSCSLKKIEGEIEWWNSLRWDDDEIKNIFQQCFQAYPQENCSRKRKYK